MPNPGNVLDDQKRLVKALQDAKAIDREHAVTTPELGLDRFGEGVAQVLQRLVEVGVVHEHANKSYWLDPARAQALLDNHTKDDPWRTGPDAG